MRKKIKKKKLSPYSLILTNNKNISFKKYISSQSNKKLITNTPTSKLIKGK